MRPSTLDRKLVRDVLRLKGQILAIALVLAGGLSTYVGMLSTMDSLHSAMTSYYARYRFADAFATCTRAPERLRVPMARLPGVATLETRVVADVSLNLESMPEVVTGRMVSLPDRGEPALNGLHLNRGRWPRSGRGNEHEVLVSKAFAEAHDLQLSDRLYAILNQRRQTLRVVGVAQSPEFVYAIQPGGVLPDDRRFGILWMRRKALATALDMDGAFNQVALTLGPSAIPGEVLGGLDRALELYGGRGAILRKDQESYWFLKNEFDQLRSTGLVGPIIFLGVAAFLLNVVVSRLVGQQREQIAILRAFGYSRRQLGTHYLKLVCVAVMVGAALGAASGALMGRYMTAMYGELFAFPSLEYEFRIRYVLQSLLIGLVAAGIGTFHALRAAVSHSPAEAMRPPAPAVYRATLIERLGLHRWLGMPARIVLRNVERRPLKSALSVLGIGSAIALLIVGRSFTDSLRFGMELQFGVAQRQDASLQLGEPRALTAMHDLRQLPGVQYAEGTRSAAVRLRHDSRSRLTGVIGLVSEARLQRLVDADLKAVKIPPQGIVLTSKLASHLNARAGSTIWMEFLDGRRQKLRVEVAAVVETFFGMGAYMNLDALSRCLDEAPTLTSADLLIDEARLEELHRVVKETPTITAVISRKRMLRSFEEILAEDMDVMALFMSLFAGIIAGSVVYNNARLSLAEHGRELASMRVLGFSRREISAIFLGELGLLTALAIPVGILLGHLFSAGALAGMETELYRLPFVIQPATYGSAVAIVLGFSLVACWFVRRRLDHLDLIEVLKTKD